MYIIPETRIVVTNGNPSEKILVIAKNSLHFIHWCNEHNINHRSSMVKYIWRLDQLHGSLDGFSSFVDLGHESGSATADANFYDYLRIKTQASGLKRIPT